MRTTRSTFAARPPAASASASAIPMTAASSDAASASSSDAGANDRRSSVTALRVRSDDCRSAVASRPR